MLQLLQQRTKLSARIGAAKRRHGAVVYVPERERELMSRLLCLSKGRPPARAVAAVYREILSSSRAAQGQMPIGLLAAEAETVLPAARECFGACDRFAPMKSWSALAQGLQTGALSVVLLTGAELASVLESAQVRRDFTEKWFVASELPRAEAKTPLEERVLVITPRPDGLPRKANRMLILIECKSTLNAIKSLLHAMPELTLHAFTPGPRSDRRALALVAPERLASGALLAGRLEAADRAIGKTAHATLSLLGIYPATEDYAG